MFFMIIIIIIIIIIILFNRTHTQRKLWIGKKNVWKGSYKKEEKKKARPRHFFLHHTNRSDKKNYKKNGAQPLGKLKGSDQHTHR